MWQIERTGKSVVARLTPGQSPGIREPEHTWRQLHGLISASPADFWVIDVSSERMLTSESLALIIAIVRNVQAAGGRMAFAGCTPGVVNVMTSMRLTKLVPLHPDIPTAVAGLTA